jgi:hypothetical protein
MSVHDDLIIVHTFNYLHEAEMARSALDANGVFAVVLSDDAGGQEIGLQFVRGARLMVKQKDERRAKTILKLG